MLTHWARDRRRGRKLPVETVVKWHSRDTARAMGLFDRGVLKPQHRADLNIIDFDRLRLRPPRMQRDLPPAASVLCRTPKAIATLSWRVR